LLSRALLHDAHMVVLFMLTNNSITIILRGKFYS